VDSSGITPLDETDRRYDGLLELIADAPFVLLGEATHGTHEFYRARAEITKRLITERGFTAICIEGDWPDAYRVNRFVRGISEDTEAVESLSDFKRFPAWMWRNAEVLDFISWLREYNDGVPSDKRKTGFYGLDLYSMYASIEAVVRYLERVDPEAAKRAKERYACLEGFEDRSEAYAYAVFAGLHPRAAKKRSQSSSRYSAGRRRMRSSTDEPRKTNISTSSKTRASWRTPRSTTARCWTATYRPGTFAIRTWPTHSCG
jgi:erythromycin esterase-like protein